MKRTVLIVEDDEDQGAMMEFALIKAGYLVARARNGLDALRQAEQRVPDVVLLDLQMPVMTGSEFVSIFRERYGSGIPVIVVTGADNARSLADQIGAQGCLEKPLRMRNLLRLLERQVGRLQEQPPPASNGR